MVPAILIAYLAGSIPVAFLWSRRWSAVDLRSVGSGNLGAANVMRASGLASGIAVALLDAAKGAAGVAIAARLAPGDAGVAAAAGIAAILGHVCPLWLRFRGGKGVATACGVFTMLTPLSVPFALTIFTAVVWLTRYVSLGSVVASVALPPIAYALGSPAPVVIAASAAAAIIVFRHRSNVLRLWSGTERRVGARV